MQACRDLLALSVAPGYTGPTHGAPFAGRAEVTTFEHGRIWTRTVDGSRGSPAGEVRVLALSLAPRDHDFRPIGSAELAGRLLSGDGLAQLAAPFAAAALTSSEFVIAADHAGLRHLYGVQGDGWAAVSTSALELARLAAAPLDHAALATFAALGFHLGHATPFAQVHKLPAGARWRLGKGVLETSRYDPAPDDEPYPPDPVAAMADLLRGRVEQCLDAHPDAVFELSGGFDSRMLLAAVPPARRVGLRTLTLSSPGRSDADIAGAIAARFGTRHQVVDLTGLAALSPEAAYELVMASAWRHDTVGNPVALGVLDWAESQVVPGVRVTGQAGEMCRGPYHQGQRQHSGPDVSLVDRLTRWRFLTNDVVDPAALTPDFAAQVGTEAISGMRRAFAGYDTDWLTAIDEFYLRERVHRWVGINFSGACLDRTIVGIFLDPRFLALARSVPQAVKDGSGYAARVLERLDPELARLRLGAGARPRDLPRRFLFRALGERSVATYLRHGTGKVLQRVRRSPRTPAGTPALADLVVRHWRAHPELAEPALRAGLVREDWLAGLLAGRHRADVATVGFLVNLVALADHQEAAVIRR